MGKGIFDIADGGRTRPVDPEERYSAELAHDRDVLRKWKRMSAAEKKKNPGPPEPIAGEEPTQCKINDFEQRDNKWRMEISQTYNIIFNNLSPNPLQQ